MRPSLNSLFSLAALSVGSVSVHAAGNVPSFVRQGVYSANAATVLSTHTSLKTDFIVTDGGSAAGFERGFVANVLRGTVRIGEVIIVEATADRTAALILNLDPETAIQTGDTLRIRTL